jgi:hypothetical protein
VKLPPQHGVPGRYAAALYMAAVKTDSLQKVEAELSQVANLMSESKDFNSFVADPTVPREVKIDGLNSILSKMGATDITKNFIGAQQGEARDGKIRGMHRHYGFCAMSSLWPYCICLPAVSSPGAFGHPSWSWQLPCRPAVGQQPTD